MSLLRYILGVLGTLVYIILYFVFGGIVIASFYNATLRYVLGSIILFFIVVALIIKTSSDRRLRAARDEYDEIQKKHLYDAQEHCPHRLFALSQKDIGVIIMTDKWCKVCGKYLGPATLKRSIFGNKWE
jgi:ABC-type multidrug transport system fused ATPase/permease subunit